MSVRTLDTGSGLLLLDTSSNCLCAYNDSARYAWQLVRDGWSGDALADKFAEHFAIPLATARRDTDAILDEWRSRGLIGTGGVARCATDAGGVDHGRGAPVATWAATWSCRFRGCDMSFAVEDTLRAAGLRALFQHLEVPTESAQVRIEVTGAEADEAMLAVDGTERVRTSDPGVLIGALYQAVLQKIHPRIDWLALVHGGALARNGVGIGLPAPSGSGKTTLIAYLMTRGFEYLADDLLAIAAPDGSIVPWPMPLGVKDGSMELLASLHPALRGSPSYPTRGRNARLLLPATDAWEREPTPLRCLIFPRFVTDAPARCSPLSPFEALERLLRDRIWFGYPLAEDRVQAFVTWLEDTPSYAISYSSAEAAARCVEEVIG